MEYSITPSEDGSYIVIKVEGNITRKEAMQQNREAHALGKQLGINRYLVDVTEARNVEPPIENYEFAYNDMHRDEKLDITARIAALVDPDDHSHDFVETVSRNAGFDMRLFRDRDEALRYLQADTSK
jgi:hypothetical protein